MGKFDELKKMKSKLVTDSDLRQLHYEELAKEHDELDFYDKVLARGSKKLDFPKLNTEERVQISAELRKSYLDFARDLVKHRIDSSKRRHIGTGRLIQFLVEELYFEQERKREIVDKLILIFKRLNRDFEKAVSARKHSRKEQEEAALKDYEKGQEIFARMLYENALHKDDFAGFLSDKELRHFDFFKTSAEVNKENMDKIFRSLEQ